MTGRKTLGRGLSALIPEVEEGITSIEKIDIDLIEARSDQPRKNFENIEELAESIREYGLLNPIVLSKNNGKYEIIAGERRYRASIQAGLKKIDAIVRDFDQKDIDILSLVENIQREDLSALEEAEAYKKLMDDFSMTQEEIAKSMGKSRSYIANTIRLLKLNQEETDALAARKISASQARTLLSIKDEDERKKTLDDFINKKINVRDAEKISKKKNSEEKAITKGLSDIDKILLEDYEEKFMEKVGSKVKIDKTGKTYKLIIDCFTVDDIENIYWRLGDEDN
ncbi:MULTISPECIES: ParB/RepB/Spo0J family partition protein [Anaerococcus]|uniref:ParB/RepB/Spo0J family partition protein n=1 Tax=Anaerococcus TaxID=165779 RepID=UPI0027B8FCE6|nr:MULTISPECIES: ParB/RepB/Spo0J family partition protein [Anaerococcus]MDU2558899.1 ParB/RepB/Spo0J family partition protein [Anaerococcus prevotii]MDU2584736.1 ParB/RepB/Spo0J family partition protein [Anaerococcus prevotii]MDU3136045.1 ParB/RepB/Spo0J family partition protein [Anaerococcus prevotii]